MLVEPLNGVKASMLSVVVTNEVSGDASVVLKE